MWKTIDEVNDYEDYDQHKVISLLETDLVVAVVYQTICFMCDKEVQKS